MVVRVVGQLAFAALLGFACVGTDGSWGALWLSYGALHVLLLCILGASAVRGRVNGMGISRTQAVLASLAKLWGISHGRLHSFCACAPVGCLWAFAYDLALALL